MLTELVVIEIALALIAVIIIRGVDQAYKGAKRVRALEKQLNEMNARLSKTENDYMQLGADLYEVKSTAKDMIVKPQGEDFMKFYRD